MRPHEFAGLMEAELLANEHKGDFAAWDPTIHEAMKELAYHTAKLCFSLNGVDGYAVTEHAADVGNIAMKIADRFGLQRKEEECQATRRSRSIGSRSTERVSGAASAAPSSSSTSASAVRSANVKTTTNANAKGVSAKSSARRASKPSANRVAVHAETER